MRDPTEDVVLQKPGVNRPRIMSFLITNIDIKLMDDFPCLSGQCDRSDSSSPSPPSKSPVIRILGSASSGQSSCVYVHGVIPYMYFRPMDLRDELFANLDWIQSNLELMRMKIEDAIKAQKINQGWTKVNSSIWKMEIVSKKSLYGYHTDNVYFVKLYCKQYNDVQRICTLLTDVGIFGSGVMQCYEAHIPPLLQFLQDFNLYGMNWMHVSDLTWRRPLPQADDDDDDDSDDDDDDDRNMNQHERLYHNHMDRMYRRVTEATAKDWKVWGREDHNWNEMNDRCDELSPRELFKRAMEQQPAHITDGLTPFFFNSQNSEEINQLNASLLIDHRVEGVNRPKFPVKTSYCELEADVHCSAILNARGLDCDYVPKDAISELSGSKSEMNSSMSDRTLHSHVMKMNHVKSLTALWDEERYRRIKRGLPLDEFKTPPFTDSNQRTLEDCEVEYKNRFDALVKKGALSCDGQKGPDPDTNQITGSRSSEIGHEENGDDVSSNPTQLLPCTMKSQVVMTAMDFTQDPDALTRTLGRETPAYPFEHDLQSDHDDDDDDNVDDESEQKVEQQIMEQMKECGENNLSRHHPRFREQRSLVMTQRDNADIMSLSQEYESDEFQKSSPVDCIIEDKINDATINDDGDFCHFMESVDQKLGISLPPRKPLIPASQSRSKSCMTEVLSLNGEVGRSSRREFKRSQSQSQPCCEQQKHEKKDFGPVVKRPKRPKNSPIVYHANVSPDSPLAQQDLASKSVSNNLINSPFLYMPTCSQRSSQSSTGRYLSPYSRKVLEASDILQNASYASLCLVPTYNPPSYCTVLSEITKAPLRPVVYFDKRSKESKILNQATARRVINLDYNKNRCLVPTFSPPSFQQVDRFMEKYIGNKKEKNNSNIFSQIAEATQTTDSNNNSDLHNMKRTDSTQKQMKKKRNILKNRSKITSMSVEIFCDNVDDFAPNPEHDAVFAFAWIADVCFSDSEHEETSRRSGLIVCPRLIVNSSTKKVHNYSALSERLIFKCSRLPEAVEFSVVDSELALFDALIELISVQIDPDFLLAYEIQKASFGYLEARCKLLGLDFLHLLGRFPFEPPDKRNEANNEFNRYAEDHDSGIWVSGRSVLNLWRIISGELKLQSFDLGYVVEQTLKRRMPHYSNRLLKKWFSDDKKRGRVYYNLYQLAEINMQMMDKLDILRRTSEYARLYGIDFYSVLSRGSQFRVEACLIRIAHSQGYIAASGTKLQVSRQAGLECQALVMEPESGFYEDPVVVLDFQSLYPSMMIAYNLCYTTIVGKMRRGTTGSNTSGQLGFALYSEDVVAENACRFQKDAYIAPNGSVFCPVSHREGILSMMLKELLATRQMIKRSMKMYKDEKTSSVLYRVLDARQHALKMLSNVTYGYTTSSFSGRMPMAELADAIVQCGRSTLLWTKKLIEGDESWKARVVYGDTDSVFVLLKGRTKAEAFAIGEEIANRITSLSPAAVVLKLEKVYTRSILVTKKRYAGFSYESVNQDNGSYDAKGIETQRRDNIPATQKIQEKCIRLYFTTLDINVVRQYLTAQWTKIHTGVSTKLTIQDFIFNKAVKWGRYKSDSSSPPGAIVSLKKIHDGDKMAEPPYGWRVPYVVVWGKPGAVLRDLVVSPEAVLKRGNDLSINHTYYITKVINPALDRVFRLCGVDVKEWYLSMPRPKKRLRLYHYNSNNYNTVGNKGKAKGGGGSKQQSITGFCKSTICEGCGKDSSTYLCVKCAEDGDVTSSVILQLNQVSIKERALSLVCQNCSKIPQTAVIGENGKGEMIGAENCSSIACPVFFERCRLVLRIEDLQVAVDEAESTQKQKCKNDDSSGSINRLGIEV